MKRVNKFLAILLMAGLCGNGTVGAVKFKDLPAGQLPEGVTWSPGAGKYVVGAKYCVWWAGKNPLKYYIATVNDKKELVETAALELAPEEEQDEDYATQKQRHDAWHAKRMKLIDEGTSLGFGTYRINNTALKDLESTADIERILAWGLAHQLGRDELKTQSTTDILKDLLPSGWDAEKARQLIDAKRAADASVPPRMPVTPPQPPLVKPELLEFATANGFYGAGIHLTPADNDLTEENLRDLKTFLQEQSYSDGVWVYTTKLPDELRGHTATALVQHMRKHKAALTAHGFNERFSILPKWLTAEEIARYKNCHIGEDDQPTWRAPLSRTNFDEVAAESLAAYQAAKQALIDAGLGYAQDNINATWTTSRLQGLCKEKVQQSNVAAELSDRDVMRIIRQAQETRQRSTYAEQLGTTADQLNPELDTHILQQLVLVEAALRPSATQLRTMRDADAQQLIQQDREAKKVARDEAIRVCGYTDAYVPHGLTAAMIRACKDAGLSDMDISSVAPDNFDNWLAAFKEQYKAQQKERMRERKAAIERARFNAADVHESLLPYEIAHLATLGITPTQEITHSNLRTKIAELQAAQREAALKEVEAAGFDRAVIAEAEHANPAEIKKQLKKRLALVKELKRRGINPDTVVEKARAGVEGSHDRLFKNMRKRDLKHYLKHGIDGSDMPTAEDIAKHCSFDDVVRPKIAAKQAALDAAVGKLDELGRQLTAALAALEAKEDGEDAAPDADVFAEVRAAFDAFMKDEYAKTPRFGTDKSALKSSLVTGEHEDETLGDRDEVYVPGPPFEIGGMVYTEFGHLEPRRFENRGLLSKLEWKIKVLERQLIEDADMKAINAKRKDDDKAPKAPEIAAEKRAKLEKRHKDLVALRDAWYDVVYPAVTGEKGKNAGKKLDRHAAATLLARVVRGKAGREKAKAEKARAEHGKALERKQTLRAKLKLAQTNIVLERLDKAKPADETSEEFKTWKKDRDALLKGKARLEKIIADATPKTHAEVVAAEAELWANKAMALKVRAARYREIAQATTASERNQLRAVAKIARNDLNRKNEVLRDRLYELRAKRTVANMLEEDITALEAKIKANDDRLERFKEARKKAKQATPFDDAAYADLAKLLQETADELDAQAGKCRKHSSSMNKSWTVAQVAKVDAAIIGAALILQNILEGYAGELPADEDKRTTGQKVKEALAAILSVQRYVNSLKAFGRVFVPAKRGKKAPGFGSRLKTFGKEKTIFATGLGAATAFTGYVGAQELHKRLVK